jgi:hypothetical protein
MRELLGKAQVPEMDRIESAAEDADGRAQRTSLLMSESTLLRKEMKRAPAAPSITR